DAGPAGPGPLARPRARRRLARDRHRRGQEPPGAADVRRGGPRGAGAGARQDRRPRAGGPGAGPVASAGRRRAGSPADAHRVTGRKEHAMKPRQILAVLLIVGGVLALAYRGFSYTKETHEAKIGPLEVQVQEKKYVDLPVWLGAGAVVVGAVLLVTGKKG